MSFSFLGTLRYFFLFFIFIILVIIFFGGVQWFSSSVTDILLHRSNFLSASLGGAIDNAQAKTPILSINQNELPLRNWQTENLTLEARSAISVEIGAGQSKVLFEKNEEKKLPIASLAKLMTALVVLDNYDLSKKFTIDDSAMAQEGEQGVLKLGQVLTIKDLLYVTLMESSNRAAFALSEVWGNENFVAAMNKNANNMGLSNTHFTDATGLDPGSYSTVQDLTKLTQYLFEHYPLFKEIINLKEYDLYLPDGSFHHKLVSTNEFLWQDNVVGGKTGYTKEAEGCFMVIQESPQRGNYLIDIILGSSDRFGEMKKMMDWINIAYRWQY